MNEKKLAPQEVTNQSSPEEIKESEALSRRSFMRRSAEVAAFSLFGVLALDGVVDKVLQRIAENQAMGKLSDAAAGALKRNRLNYYADANTPHPGCSAETHCDLGYVCPGDVICTTYTPHDCDSDEKPYGCTTKKLTCGVGFECDVINCPEMNRFTCVTFTPCPDSGHNCVRPYSPS